MPSMPTCYDCLHLKAKIPVLNDRILYRLAVAHCALDNLTKGVLILRRFYRHVIPETPKKAFETATWCQDFNDMRD